jgi:uncharacterized protein YecE (DUF72 family)
MQQDVRVGCSGFQKSQAEYYRYFSVVEIQQTFYKPPLPKTAIRWRNTAPENFLFTLKAWQVITHEPYSQTYRRSGLEIPRSDWSSYGSFRNTWQVRQAWDRTREIAGLLRAAVILFQCPPQFTPTEEHIQNFQTFFSSIDREGFRFAWEPRGRWPDSVVRDLCTTHDLIHAVDPFLQPSLVGKEVYYRLHGGADYQYQYTDEDLLRLKDLLTPNQPGFVFFNNVTMWENGLRFQKLFSQITSS